MDTIYYKKAIILVWLCLSLIGLTCLTIPFVLSEESIYKITPKCQWKEKYNKECLLCGMTSGFIDVSKGEFKQAYKENRGSIFLFIIFLTNSAAFVVYCFRQNQEQF
ncbi:MAG: hypothetical protein ACM34K_13125 [Bacillota bacterium]